jgi:hypothetical protein
VLLQVEASANGRSHVQGGPTDRESLIVRDTRNGNHLYLQSLGRKRLDRKREWERKKEIEGRVTRLFRNYHLLSHSVRCGKVDSALPSYEVAVELKYLACDHHVL